MADATAIFRLSQQIGQQPILISSLAAIGIDAVGVELLKEALPAVTSKDDLSGLEMPDMESMSRMHQRALQGEEAFGMSIFSDIGSGRFDWDQLAPIVGGTSPTPSSWILSHTPTMTLLNIFYFHHDAQAYRDLFDQHRTMATTPFYPTEANLHVLAGKDTRAIRSGGLLTAILTPAMHSVLQHVARAQAANGAALVAVATTRYRLDHGSLPEKLDVLVPAYLDEIPADPFDGKPLRLVHKDDQWIVYSIGPDGKDDGGQAYDREKKTGDIGFALKDSAAAKR